MDSNRTNFYKNPSISYQKDFNLSSVLQNLKVSAYNAAIVKTPSIEEQSHQIDEEKSNQPRKNRRRKADEVNQNDKRIIDDIDDQLLTHQIYVEKIRKEFRPSGIIEEVTQEMLVLKLLPSFTFCSQRNRPMCQRKSSYVFETEKLVTKRNWITIDKHSTNSNTLFKFHNKIASFS